LSMFALRMAFLHRMVHESLKTEYLILGGVIKEAVLFKTLLSNISR
jgi:hypothetical protein